MLAVVKGKAQSVRFQPGPELGGKAEQFKAGDAVWLSLNCPVVNPFTGERAIAVQAIVLSVVGSDVHIVTVRSTLMGAVPASRLAPRFPDELSPGRKDRLP